MKRAAAGILRLAVREALGESPRHGTQEAFDALAPAEVDSLLLAAAHHRVESMLHLVLDRPPVGGALGEAYAQGLGGHLRAQHDVGRVAQALDGAEPGGAGGLPWAVIKGPALAVTAYPRADLRRYGDLDVLVEPTRLADALEALEAAGFVVLDTNWRFLADNLLGEVHLAAPGGSSVDLHWSLHNRPSVRARFRFDTGDLLSRRRRVEFGSTSMPVLDPADACVHVCLHAGLGGGDRLLWLADVALSARQVPDGDLLAARVRAAGAEVLTALMLSRAGGLLRLAGGGELVSQLLVSPSVRAWVVACEWVAPIGAPARPAIAVGLPSLVARTLAPRPATLLANMAGAVRRRRAPAAARVSVFDRGDPRDRAAYLDGVAAAGR